MSQCYILSLYVVHFKGALNSGEAQDETTQNLFVSLSSAGVGKFTGYVKSEKINMHISESEAQ
jgi:hypothetical protein